MTVAPDSITAGIEYFVSDIQLKAEKKIRTYRLVWLFEGELLEIVGVVNAFRARKKQK
jgi:hypothetical protein